MKYVRLDPLVSDIIPSHFDTETWSLLMGPGPSQMLNNKLVSFVDILFRMIQYHSSD